jgi:trans-aconitate 2-methyltransferase
MSDWNPTGYLKFEKERNQPAIDLVRRISHDNPESVLDIGCGPGNSTGILYDRWKDARIIGLDSSPAMLEKAKNTNKLINWILGDASGDLSQLGKFDVIFSNAAFQWIPDNEILINKLFNMLNPDGVLAVQVPYMERMQIRTVINKVVDRADWAAYFANLSIPYKMNTPDFYYDILSSFGTEIYLWETRYFQIMNSHDDLLQWCKSTALRPYMDCLVDEGKKSEFEKDILLIIKNNYKTKRDDKVLFPFDRIFFIAYR